MYARHLKASEPRRRYEEVPPSQMRHRATVGNTPLESVHTKDLGEVGGLLTDAVTEPCSQERPSGIGTAFTPPQMPHDAPCAPHYTKAQNQMHFSSYKPTLRTLPR